jgi:outer membrane protein TolC
VYSRAAGRRRTVALPALVIAVAIASRAGAQQVKPLDPAAPAPTTPVPAGNADVLPPAPPPPPVSDPMLAPPPAATRELASWGDAVALSRSRSTDLGIALAEVRRAEAATRTALAAVLPTINGTAAYPHQFFTKETQTLGAPGAPSVALASPQSDYFNGNVTLTQSIINVQAWHAIGTGKANEKATKLSAEDVQRFITLGVAAAVVGVVAAERVAELNRIGLRSALERRELAVRKRALGVATGLDTLRADQDVAASRALIVSGDESLRRSREALGLALGVPDQIGVARSINIDGVTAEAERTCPRIKDLGERADLAAARQRLVVSERNIVNIDLSFLPTISAQSTLASTTAQISSGTPRTTWSVTAVLTVPIWDGGARYGALRNARALRDESGFQLEALRRTATVEVAQAQRSITVAEDALDVARQAEKLAAEVDRLTQTSYRTGQGTSLELVLAAAALRQAQVELALREFDLVRARLDALFALARCPGSI